MQLIVELSLSSAEDDAHFDARRAERTARTRTGKIDRRPGRGAERRAAPDGAQAPRPCRRSSRTDPTRLRRGRRTTTHIFRIGTSSGTVTPWNASRGDRCSSADSWPRDRSPFGRRDECLAHSFDGRRAATENRWRSRRRTTALGARADCEHASAARPSSRGRIE